MSVWPGASPLNGAVADPPLAYATFAMPLNVLPLRLVTVMVPVPPGPRVALYATTRQLAGRPERSAPEEEVDPAVPEL